MMGEVLTKVSETVDVGKCSLQTLSVLCLTFTNYKHPTELFEQIESSYSYKSELLTRSAAQKSYNGSIKILTSSDRLPSKSMFSISNILISFTRNWYMDSGRGEKKVPVNIIGSLEDEAWGKSDVKGLCSVFYSLVYLNAMALPELKYALRKFFKNVDENLGPTLNYERMSSHDLVALSHLMRSVTTLYWNGEERGGRVEMVNLIGSVKNARFARATHPLQLNNLININFSLILLKIGPDGEELGRFDVADPSLPSADPDSSLDFHNSDTNSKKQHIANSSIYRILNQSPRIGECGLDRLTMLCWCCARDEVLASNKIFRAVDEGFKEVNSYLAKNQKFQLKKKNLIDNPISNNPSTNNVVTNKILGNVAYSAAKLNFYMPNLIEYIEKYHRFEEDDDPQAATRHQGRAKGLSNVAWFFAKTGVYSERVFSNLEEDCMECVEEWDPKCRSVVMWSICILGEQNSHEKFLKFLWDNRVLCPTDAQVLLLTEPTGVDLECTKGEIDELKGMVGGRGRVSISRGQDEVFGYLEMITDGAVSEERNLNQILSKGSDWGEYLNVDAVVDDGGESLVVEYNGPQHYLTAFEEDGGYGFQENGVTWAKMNWLKRRGFEVVVIPFWEWPEEAEEREEYLRTKLGRRRTWAEWKEEEREWKLLE